MGFIAPQRTMQTGLCLQATMREAGTAKCAPNMSLTEAGRWIGRGDV